MSFCTITLEKNNVELVVPNVNILVHHKTEKCKFLDEKVTFCAPNRFAPESPRLLLDAESESEIRI